MGKGDRKTRRGKIYRGSFGKSRPKDPDKKRTAPKSTATKK
ncbi:MAG TPA: 30S ribosomal protein THX [Steroidobacteraceae bacterium]|nr:30S ribosomal protein THX [Steroidobacteraceae bacterium]